MTERKWNLGYFKQINLPILVGEIENKEKFSRKVSINGRGYLDLPIHMPQQGWKIPDDLNQFLELIFKCINDKKKFDPNFEIDHYVYITVAQSLVDPNTSQRRSGWHCDSFRRKKNKIGVDIDTIYLAYDSIPTLFSDSTFDFSNIDTENLQSVIKYFNTVCSNKNVITYEPYQILKLDPFVVHNANINDSSEKIKRTFVRISISKKQYRNGNNTHNSLFNYDWNPTTRWDRKAGL
jgi:hypothetical protein